MQHRQFTLEEANSLLPGLRERFSTLASLREKIQALESEIKTLGREGRRNGGQSIEERIKERQERRQEMRGEHRDGERRIAQDGIIVRDTVRGLVDFPSIRDGQDIHLCWCWNLDEGDIGYWHPVNSGFSARQSL